MRTNLQAVATRIAEIEARVASMGAIGRSGGVAGSQDLNFAASLDDATSAQATRSMRAAAGTGLLAATSGSNPYGSLSAAPGAAGEWARALPESGRAWADDIQAAANRHGIEPELLGALVWAESGFDQGAVSHAGAIGLGQLMLGTAAGMGVDPHDPQQNLDGAARYLRDQLDRFGAVDLALAAYNAGPARVAQAGGVPRIAETEAYVPRVINYMQRLKGSQ